MEQNQLSQESVSQVKEPENISDNSLNSENTEKISKENAGKSSDPVNLILGKFKSADDLAEAYKQLERLQGNQSSELGALREKVASMNNANDALKVLENIFQNKSHLQEIAKKYPEQFSDPSFKQIYSEAYLALGDDLDSDKLVNLIESYVSARIFAYEKSKIAEAETQKALGSMKFEKNDKTVSAPVKKSIQQMTPKELDEMLERLI